VTKRQRFRTWICGLWGKPAWKWLETLVVPALLAVVAVVFTWYSGKVDRDVAAEQAREAALQTYLDRMEDLMLDEGLRTSSRVGDERRIAQARTLAALRQLDGRRKGELIRFLVASRLIENDIHAGRDILSMGGADLRDAELRDVFFVDVNFQGADLSGADLRRAYLGGAHLAKAKLKGADLSSANLTDAGLFGADLSGANVADAILTGAFLDQTNLDGVRNWTQEQFDSTDSYQDVENPPRGLEPDLRP